MILECDIYYCLNISPAGRCGRTLLYTDFVWISIIGACVSFALFVQSMRYTALPVTRYFRMLVLIAVVLSVIMAVDVCLTDLEGKVAIMRLRSGVVPLIYVAVFGMLVSQAGHHAWLTPRRILLISLPELAAIVLGVTSAWHDLFFLDPVLHGTGPYVLSLSPGLLYWAYFAYSSALLLVGLWLLLGSSRKHGRLYRRQAVVILVALLVPFVYDLVWNVEPDVSSNVDLLALTFAMSGTILFWGLYRYRILEVKPVARDEVIDNIADSLVVVSTDNRLIDFNLNTERLLSTDGESSLGATLSEALPFGRELEDMIARRESKGDVMLGGTTPTSFEASVVPVNVDGEEMARIVLLRDITERKNMEEALRTANARLSILSSVTRHDLRNKLTAIQGYAALANDADSHERSNEYIGRLLEVCDTAGMLIEFAREYETLGVNEPGWFSLHDLFTHATVQNDLNGIKVTSCPGPTMVYADAMIEKVLYNLVENSLRHGMEVTAVGLGSRMEGGTLVIEYTDDGVGVPPEDKERIFERGFGSNTGLGLFLSREILAITGIEIVETGVKGVRFELRVPPGRYRFSS